MSDCPEMMNRSENPTVSRTRKCTLKNMPESAWHEKYPAFSDDGYSGTNFNRPGFNALLEEIEAGHVAVLIVKKGFKSFWQKLPASRLLYRGCFSRKKGIRFIAINNSVDSANPSDNDLYPRFFEHHE